jgi:two-component system phosphate regulon sensor histidine kinase PhoR
MATNVERSWTVATVTAASIAVFAMLLFIVARSFRMAIADIAEAKTRVTIINADGSVFYDTDGAIANHATREEIVRAFANGQSSTLRRSDTTNQDVLYCARRIGERVVRLAIPYTGVRRSEILAWAGLAAACGLGACGVFFVFTLTRRLSSRLDEKERQLAIAAANETFRQEFTANVTHELKSPLTAILGAVEMLDDSSNLTEEERRDLFDIIHGESGRLSMLVGDVLSLAQIERETSKKDKDFGTLPLSELIVSVVELEQIKATAEHVRMEIIRNDAAFVKGDAGRLEEVLQNLVTNALRYSGTDRIEISSVASRGIATVSVSDYGIGIAEHHLPHLFERFYRVNKSRSRTLGGTGLGLAIVKHIVRLHGGDVFVNSRLGIKTTFGFTIPLA